MSELQSGFAQSWPDVPMSQFRELNRLKAENQTLLADKVLLRGQIVALKEKLAELRRGRRR